MLQTSTISVTAEDQCLRFSALMLPVRQTGMPVQNAGVTECDLKTRRPMHSAVDVHAILRDVCPVTVSGLARCRPAVRAGTGVAANSRRLSSGQSKPDLHREARQVIEETDESGSGWSSASRVRTRRNGGRRPRLTDQKRMMLAAIFTVAEIAEPTRSTACEPTDHCSLTSAFSIHDFSTAPSRSR